MAARDYQEAPEVAADPSAGDDLQHVNVTTDTYGGAFAEGLGKLGAGLLDASKFYGTVAANNGTNNTMEEVNKILHGDPEKTGPGPDGQPGGDTGYLGLKGANAMSARAETAHHIDEVIARNRESLSTPESKIQYDQDTRRFRETWMNDIGSHAVQQQNIWAKDTNDTTAALALNNFARKPSDEAAYGEVTNTVRRAYVQNAMLAGESESGAVLKADQAVAEAQVKALLLTDPPAAQAAFKKHQDVLAGSPSAYPLARELQARNEDWLTGIYSDPATVQSHRAEFPKPGPQTSMVAGAVQPFNIGNVKTADGKGFVVPATAQDGVILAANNLRQGYRGLTLQQIGEKWAPAGADNNKPADWVKNVSTATGIKPGDKPNLDDPKTLEKLVHGIGVAEKNDKDRAAFTPEVITQGVAASLSGQHAKTGSQAITPPQFDTQKAQGMTKPGNVDPWNRPVLHNPDGSYSTTSSISIGTDNGEVLIPTVVDGKRLSNDDAIAHFKTTGENLGTFGTPEDADKYATALHNAQASMYDAHGNALPAKAPEDPYLAFVRQEAREKLGPDNPNGVEQVVQRVKFNLNRDDSATATQVSETVKDTIAYLNDGGDPTKLNMTPESVRASIPGQKGEDAASDLSTAIDYAKSVRQIATASPEQLNDILAGHVPQGPENYQATAESFKSLQKAAQERVQAIYGTATKPGDPAGYVTQYMPDVAQSFATALSSQDPAAFDRYVVKMNGAYGALGVPDNLRSILPRQTSAAMIGTLQGAPPQQAVQSLQALQKETGKWWPVMYRDLVRAGLPSTFQTALVVAGNSPKDGQVMVAALQHDALARVNKTKTLEEETSGMMYQTRSVNEVINRKVPDGLKDLRASFGIAGRSGVDSYAGVQSAVEQTARYLYLQGGILDPNDAVNRAAAMVTSQFDFVQQTNAPPARLPRGTAGDFDKATRGLLNSLKPSDVRPYAVETNEHGEAIDIPASERASHALQGAKNAYWVTVPGHDGRGAVRAIDPQTGTPVMKANGQMLDIPFANMKLLAAQHRADVGKQQDEAMEAAQALQ